MRPNAVLAVALLAALAALVWCSAAASASETAVIRLEPGQNVVSWNGAEPYAISRFAGTPVTQIHRWDAVRQQWLSHIVGRDGATLPEGYLLPRVQYLLVAEAKHELDVPDPIAGVDPLAELRQAAPPDDPLRFEAWWPNEDSPLEDLIVLRPDDERLSVKAEVAGGVGEIEVYWVLDGRLNHHGLASDDVELLPGKHDGPVLYAVDDSAQVVVVELPRVVRLPAYAPPERMQVGVTAFITPTHLRSFPGLYSDFEGVERALDLMVTAGFDFVRFDMNCNWLLPSSSGKRMAWRIEGFDHLIEALDSRGLKAMPLVRGAPRYASAGRLDGSYKEYAFAPFVDPKIFGECVRFIVDKWPQIGMIQLFEEPNNGKTGYLAHWAQVPSLVVSETKQAALGAWYENPEIRIIAGGLVHHYTDDELARGDHEPFRFLARMLQRGYGMYIDDVALHIALAPPASVLAFQYKPFTDFDLYMGRFVGE